MNLTNLTDGELLKSTRAAVQSERDATTNVIRHFQEIYDRKLFLPRYTSMFEMLRGEYHYCAGSAQIRLNAMKLIRDVPAVEEKIEAGEMTLSAAASVQSFLQFEKKKSRPYSANAKIELVETCAGKSTREIEKEFARRDPEVEKRESVRFTSEDRLRVSHSISVELEEKLNRIKEIWSHVDPDMSREDLLNRMAEIILDKIDPRRKAERSKMRAQKSAADGRVSKHETKPFHAHETKLRARAIRADARHQVYLGHDGGGCEHIDPINKKRCRSNFQLQFDHIKPFSAGGANSAGNLRLYCAQHNRWRYRSENLVRAGRVAYR